MKSHTSLLDHHQRSHYDTITIGPKGLMNWVLQLNNSQSVKLFNCLVENFNMQKSPNQPNQKPNQSVIDRGNLRKDVFVDKGKTSRSHEIDEKDLHEELGSSDRLGNVINCLKTSVLSMLTMEQDILLSKTAQKEQIAPRESRRYVTRTTSSIVQSTGRTLTSTYQDYHILQ